MSLFVISDLHLSSDGSKSMEVFGARWADYQAKIKKMWNAIVSAEDTVVIPGDISWSMKLEDTLEDFLFLESLPGKKLIGKGNHDFWWATVSKMTAFLKEHDIKTIQFLYNNAYLEENCIVCGTRGWFLEENQQNTVGEVDFSKMINREVLRLRWSLDAAKKLQEKNGNRLPILVFLHFPPVWNDFVCREIVDTLKEYGVKKCYFGHIHGAYFAKKITEFEGIDFIMTAADYLQFTPMPVFPD